MVTLILCKTHFSDDTTVLYHNDAKGNFEDRTLPAHLGVETRYTNWGTGILDLDNDGWPDIFIATGAAYPGMEKKLPRYKDKSPRVLFRNLGNGTFEELTTEAGPAINTAHTSRGCAFGDFDNDGDLDILIVNLNEPPSLLRNDLQMNHHHWLKVKLVGTKSNRSAIGARVKVRYGDKLQTQAVLSQSSFYSANDPRLHFGLGPETRVSMEVIWPNGVTEKFSNVPADRLLTIEESKGIVRSKGWAKN